MSLVHRGQQVILEWMVNLVHLVSLAILDLQDLMALEDQKVSEDPWVNRERLEGRDLWELLVQLGRKVPQDLLDRQVNQARVDLEGL